MKHSVNFLIAVSLLLLCLITVSCAKIAMPGQPSEDEMGVISTLAPTHIAPAISDSDPLDGTQWELRAFKDKEKLVRLPEQPRFFVQFKKGELLLHGGCNSIGGHYVIKNNHITITFVKRTEMDCSNLGPQINEIEQKFIDAMLLFKSYAIEGEQLRINYDDGTILLSRAQD